MAFMDEHEKFLADRLHSDNRSITYRELSKALHIHVNTAKGLLFRFHQSQSRQRKGTVRATYLVCGTLVPSLGRHHENTDLSSQTDGSPQSKKESELILVGEVNLQEQLQLYQSVSSIHIYGLSPSSSRNPWLEEICGQANGEVSTNEAENKASIGKLGTIYNSRVRRRERNTALHTVSSLTLASKSSAEQADNAKKLLIPSPIPNERSQSHSLKPTLAKPTDRMTPGSILQSFAKTHVKSRIKAATPAKNLEGSASVLSDDGDADDSSDILPTKVQPQPRAHSRTRKHREEGLRRMMEEEEQAEEHATEEASTTDQQKEETIGSEPEPEPDAEARIDSAMSGCNGQSGTTSSANHIRYRGKRRVMQKKRILDDQGYMVTIQEPGWESFSEDDTLQPPVKKTVIASAPSSSIKSKKSSSKGAQGSITSFFNKR
ncbi:hypothetical protein E4U57_006358 [Claviceps arundinis]|uniref:DNA polymerase delta subunit 3 n=1 Tax=Claviceps arundinis TaxID=1623583 RepID=A0A9P7SM13_9HYPO|nr:hypothetical protein E4U57_006358 [Claviceps arundinis]KAG5958273.1 hypothetical protein E4U56_005705 [Claviceps arundinis]